MIEINEEKASYFDMKLTGIEGQRRITLSKKMNIADPELEKLNNNIRLGIDPKAGIVFFRYKPATPEAH